MSATDADNSIMAAIAAASLDALITIDDAGCILEFGPAAEQLFGYTRAEVMGRSVSEIVIPPHLRQAHESGMEKFNRTGEGPVLNNRVEVPAIRRDGSEFPAELTVVPLTVAGKQLFTAFVRDISERKRHEAELEAARAVAERASEAKSRFLAHMSHELRSPLNAVLGAINLMMDSPLAPEQQMFAQTARSSGQALLELINEVLDYSRIESGELTLRAEPVELSAIVNGLVSSAALGAAEKGLEVAQYIGPRVPHLVRGDPGRLRQVLANLVDNAIKYTQSGGVTVSVEVLDEPADRVRLSFAVADTGIGIADEDQQRLFGEFSQVDESDSTAATGVGLGLAIVQRLVAAMGGRIELDSASGRGSCFRIELELDVIRGRHATEPLPARPAVVISGSAVLREAAARQLQSIGLTVTGAASIGELSAARLAEAVLIFADIGTDPEAIDALRRGLTAAEVDPARVHLLLAVGAVPDMAGFGAPLFKPLQPAALLAVACGTLRAQDAPPAAPAAAALQQRRGRVLLVEDGPTNQLIAGAMLERAGFEVDIANNGHEAVEAAAAEDYAVILMDLRMPIMDGLEATRRIRQLPGAAAVVPIIALTANALSDDRSRCMAAGMSDFATKPIDREELVRKIEKQLGPSPAVADS